jgi:hypothetical protein
MLIGKITASAVAANPRSKLLCGSKALLAYYRGKSGEVVNARIRTMGIVSALRFRAPQAIGKLGLRCVAITVEPVDEVR